MNIKNAPDIICDVFVAFFAVWTVACHATVLSEGNLYQAITVFLILAISILTALWWALGRERGQPSKESAPLPDNDSKGIRALDSTLTPRQIIVFCLILAFVFSAIYCIAAKHYMVAWLICLACLGLAFVPKGAPDIPHIDSAQVQSSPNSIWWLAALSVCITLTAHRPDSDDGFYVNVAVAAADDPHAPLLKYDTMLGIPETPIHLSLYKILSLEVLAGALSLTSGIPAIYIMHIVFPAIASALIVFAYARLLNLFVPGQTVWAILLVIAVLCASGHPHASYGNMSFVRLHQGKAILATLMCPLVILYSLLFMSDPCWKRWVILAASQIVCLGLSPVALWLTPATAALGLIAGVSNRDLNSVKAFCAGISASSYILGFGLFFKQTLKEMPTRVYSDGRTWETLFERFLAYAFGHSAISILFLVVALTTWFFCRTRLARRMCIVFPLLFLATFLNPFLLVFLADNVTGGQPQWRCMWMVPLPMMASIFLIVSAPGSTRVTRKTIIWVLTLVLLFASQRSILSPSNRTKLAWPTLKVDQHYRTAEALVRLLGNRSYVLVPSPVSIWLTTFHDHPYPMLTKTVYYHYFVPTVGEELMNRRLALKLFIDGKYKPTNSGFLQSSLRALNIQGVCLPLDHPFRVQTQKVLAALGYENRMTHGYCELWVRKKPFRPTT